MRKNTAAGFTLVELMIVVMFIAVLMAISIPNFISARIRANEKTCVATMRTVLTAQSQIQSAASIDVDGDGMGEYGYFAELSGQGILRGVSSPLAPPALAPAFGDVRNGRTSRSGYLFQVFLPGPGGNGVAEDTNGGKADLSELDTDLAETFWCVYAWPMKLDQTGNNAFFVNQVGQILSCTNRLASYNGQTNTPAPTAAFLTATSIVGLIALNSVGQDGERWVTVQ